MNRAPETMEDALRLILNLQNLCSDYESRLEMIQDEAGAIIDTCMSIEEKIDKDTEDEDPIMGVYDIGEAASEIGLIISLSPGKFEEFRTRAIFSGGKNNE